MVPVAIGGWRQRIRKIRFRTMLYASLVTLLVLVWLGSAVQLWFERTSYLELAARSTENLSLALAEYTRQSFENVDNTLQDIATQSAQWHDKTQQSKEAEALHVLAERDSIIRSIRLYDADGNLWLSSEPPTSEAQSVATREDFLAHKQSSLWGSGKLLHVGFPERIPSGEWRYPLSRRIADAKGKFQGMAVANLEASTFDSFFATLDVGDKGLVVMLRSDAVLLIRKPKLESAIGRFPFNATIPRLASQAAKGSFRFTSQYDQVDRIGYFRVVEGYPLIVAVTIAADHALAPWRRLVVQFALTLAVISVAVFLLGWALSLQHDLFERAEARARERQRQLESISLNMPAVVFQRVREPDGRSYYTFVDPKIRDVFGVTVEQVMAGVTALQAVTHPEDAPLIIESFEHSATELSMWRQEFRIHPPGKGPQWIRGVAASRLGADGRVIWDGVFFNITSEKHSEEHLQRAHRMETVGQLSSGVAHQFNNLLMSIQGHLELIQLDSDPSHPVHASAGTALEAVQRGATLTRQLLAFSRKQRLEPTAFDLNQALQETGELLAALLGRSVNLTFQLQPGLPGVQLDRGQFQTAIVALALNAKEAMPSGGTLAFSTAVEELSAQDARAHGAAPGHYVVVRVRDSGVGMPQAVQLRAFEPFFTTKGMEAGAGMGLSQVHGFMKQSGGHTMLRSQPNEGTDVALYFPMLPGDGTGHSGAGAPKTPQGGRLDSTQGVQ